MADPVIPVLVGLVAILVVVVVVEGHIPTLLLVPAVVVVSLPPAVLHKLALPAPLVMFSL